MAYALTPESGGSLSLLKAADFRPFGYAAIWAAYLLRSARVAATYARAGDRLADVFG